MVEKSKPYGMKWWNELSPTGKEDALEPLIKAKRSNKEICAELGIDSINKIAGIRNRLISKHPEYAGGSRGTYIPGKRVKQTSAYSFIASLPLRKPEEKPERDIFDTRLGKREVPQLQVHRNPNPVARDRYRKEEDEDNKDVFDVPETAKKFLRWRQEQG